MSTWKIEKIDVDSITATADITFKWNLNNINAEKVYLRVGTSDSTWDVYNASVALALSKQLTGIVLSTDHWAQIQYIKNLTTTSLTTPEIYEPVFTVFDGTTKTFKWRPNNETQIVDYELDVGTSGVGSTEILDSGSLGLTFSKEVTGLPTNGSTVYVRLKYKKFDVWTNVDYTYEAQDISTPKIVNPAPGDNLTDSSFLVTWVDNGVASIIDWRIVAGTSATDTTYYDSGALGSGVFSHTVSGIPQDASDVYLSLRYKIGAAWFWETPPKNIAANREYNSPKIKFQIVSSAVSEVMSGRIEKSSVYYLPGETISGLSASEKDKWNVRDTNVHFPDSGETKLL